MCALLARERTGRGLFIDSSMLAGQIALLTYQAGVYFATDADPARTGNAHPIIAAYQTFQVLTVMSISPSATTTSAPVPRRLDLPAAAHRDTWATNEGRIADLPELVAIISARLETMDTAHLVALLDAAAVPCGPTYTVPEALRQPQAAEYSLWTQVDHPTLGRLDQLGFPYHLSATPCEIRLPPPLLGLHTDDVLGEEGYTREEIAQLRADGVI
ncbi:MAG: CoA transferase [Chloroflexia bacterium]